MKNGVLIATVPGFPVGWIDDGHLLVNNYALTQFNVPYYVGCGVYSPTGQNTGPCALPEVLEFETVAPDSIYAVNLASILSVSTGAIGWMGGDPASQSTGAVAGSRIVFVSGARVLVQGH